MLVLGQDPLPFPSQGGHTPFASLQMMRYTTGVELANSSQNFEASQFSSGGETGLDTSRFRLTIEEASQLFADAGVPRSPRTITRFCQLGDLDCLRVETEKNFKWLIDRSSAEKRITELQQAINFTKKPYQDTSSYVETNNETQPDMSRHDELPVYHTQDEKENEELRRQREELETEVMHLRIDRAAKEQVINQMVAERQEWMSQMQDMSYRLGQATMKIEMLEAPRPETEARHVSTADETMARQHESQPPEPQPTPEPAKGGFFRRMLGKE
jgi:hypothetical protein